VQSAKQNERSVCLLYTTFRETYNNQVSYLKSKKTINSILEAARILFVKSNYADVTITELANQANVSAGAMYHHFSNKEDIYLQMMHQVLDEIRELLETAIEPVDGSCRDRLGQSVLTFLQLPEAYLGVLRLVRRDINVFDDPVRTDLIRAYQETIPNQVEDILREGMVNGEIQAVDARLLSWQMVALVEVSLHPNSRKILGGSEKMADYLTSLFLDGIAVRDIAGVQV
jgi:AcrR family transcriptional regulator